MTLIEILAENKVRLAIGNFLSTTLVDKPGIFLSVWSFVHLIAGGFIMLVLRAFKLKIAWRWGIFFVLIIGFEIVEFFLYTNLTTLFIPETFTDVLWDIIFGILGAIIIESIFFLRKVIKN